MTAPDPEPFAGLPLDEALIASETWDAAGRALVASVGPEDEGYSVSAHHCIQPRSRNSKQRANKSAHASGSDPDRSA